MDDDGVVTDTFTSKVGLLEGDVISPTPYLLGGSLRAHCVIS
jgi:hypothetical protein